MLIFNLNLSSRRLLKKGLNCLKISKNVLMRAENGGVNAKASPYLLAKKMNLKAKMVKGRRAKVVCRDTTSQGLRLEMLNSRLTKTRMTALERSRKSAKRR